MVLLYSQNSQGAGVGGGGANIIMCQRKWIKTLDQAAKGKRYVGARIVSMEPAARVR
jgi:hypothetical protein